MAIENTLIYQEVLRIFGSGSKPVKFMWRADIHVDGETVPAYRVLGLEIQRKYRENYTDEVILEVNVGAGDYDYVIAPYRDKIEITLYKEPVGSAAALSQSDRDTHNQRYRAVLMNRESGSLSNNSILAETRKKANQLQVKQVEFQLFDLNIEQLRTATYGGVFRNCRAIDVVRTVLGRTTDFVSVENELAVKGVDIAPNYDETVLNHILVPHHTPVTDIPLLIHLRYGVYGTGFWYYLQKNIWYVYPTMDIRRTTTATKILTVINVPNNRLPNVEVTYRETPNQLFVLANGKTTHHDQSETDMWNSGNATRFIDSSKMMGGFGTVADNKLSVDLKGLAVEFAAENRASGFNNVVAPRMAQSNNMCLERSKIAFKNGTELQFVWENANDSLIYPGMPLKYMTENNGRIIELTGCVVDAQYFTSLVGQTMISSEHVCKAAITIFVNKNIDDDRPV